MKTVKFCSPFLLLLLVALSFSCTKSGRQEPDVALIVDNHIKEATLASKPVAARLRLSTAAYDYARKTKRKALVWRAFNVKYYLLKEHLPDSASAFLDSYLALAKKKRDTLNMANAFFEKGNHYYALNQPDSAFYYYNSSKTEYELLKDKYQVAHKYLLMADIYWKYNDYSEMESAATEALRLIGDSLKTETDTAYTVTAENHIGLSYTGNSNYSAAMEAYKNASKLEKDSSRLKVIENNLAWVYMESGDYNKAIPILSRVVNSKAIGHDTIAKAYDNYGYSLFKTGNKNGIGWMQKGLMLRRDANDGFGLVASYARLAEYYQKDNPQLAKEYLLKAYAIATTNNSPDDRLLVLKLLRNNSAGFEREKYSDLQITLKDSINDVRQKAKNQFAKIRYDSKKRNEENLQLKAAEAERKLQLEKGARLRDILWISLFSLIVFAIMLYLLLRKKHKRDKLREAYKTETRIAKKVHDELANDVFHTIAFAETQDLSLPEKRETLLSNLDSVYLRTRDISRENSPIDTGARFPAQLRDLLSEYSTDNRNVILSGFDDVPWASLPESKKTVVHRVLQELMVNMKKHSKATIVALRFESDPKSIKISYSDNGTGMPLGKTILNNGLQNVENRINAIGGTLTFDSEPDKGVKIAFVFST